MRKNKFIKFSLLTNIVVFLFIAAFNCSSPTGPGSGLTLKVADVSCTEAWLNLSAGSVSLPVNVAVTKNDSNFLSFTLLQSDTTLYDSTLLPNQTYTYQAIYGSNKTDEVTAKTMDTTSSNFTFQKFYLGGATSSMLNDVAIINDTLAYAVGGVYLTDSTGQPNPQPYNLAIWNGKSWSIKKLFANGFPPKIKSIFNYNEDDIWFDPWFHWDGKTFQEIPSDPIFFGVGIDKIWGNSNGLYVAGTIGFISYRNSNGTWQKFESGTSLDIQDIFGYSNSNQTEVYCIASDLFTANGNMILQINGSQVKTVSNKGLPVYSFSSIWLNNPDKAYLAGSGIYINNSFSSGGVWKELNPRASNDYLNSIRGNDVNDIVAAGAFGEVVHFNGVRWVSYKSQTGLSSGEYLSVAIKGNEIIAVGYDGAKAVITIGKR